MTTAGRVVLLAYYFPPLVGIASERAASLTRHLRDLGWDPLVISARSGFYHQTTDPTEPSEGREPSVSVLRTRNPELSRISRKVYAVATDSPQPLAGPTVQAIRTGGIGDRARRLLHDFVYVPDAQVGWIPFATVAAGRALRSAASPRVLFSSSVPFSAHVAAMWAARRAGAAWVAEFRDPWSAGAWANRSRHRERLDRGLERRVVRTADHVVVTSDSTRLALLEAYADLRPERISVVTNGFEPMPPGQPPPSDQSMTILYAGTVAAGEDMAPVLSALDHVHARQPGAFRLRVLGPAEAWQSVAGAARDRPWLLLEGVVSPQRAREAMAQSSVLLLVRRHPAYRLILPGKAFEYIGARRPILAIVPPGSEMEKLVSEHGDARLVDPDAIDGLADTVERLLDEHRAGTLQNPRVAESATAPLRRAEQASKLADIFARVAR